MAIPIFVSFFLGRWLDRLLGTGGIILICFIILGVLASFRNLFKITMPKKKDKDED